MNARRNAPPSNATVAIGVAVLTIAAVIGLTREDSQPTAPPVRTPPAVTTSTDPPYYIVEPPVPTTWTPLPQTSPTPSTAAHTPPLVVLPEDETDLEREDDHHPPPTPKNAPVEPDSGSREEDGFGDGRSRIWRWLT